MKKIEFSYRNHIDGDFTTLSASSTAGNMSISYLTDPRVGRRWRSTDPNCYGQADFGGDKPIDIVALVFPRDTAFPAGTIRHCFDANGGAPGTGAIYDSTAIDLGLVDGYGIHVLRLPETISARYWRWTYALTTAFVDTGRAWAGEVWSPGVNFSWGAGDTWEDLSSVRSSSRSGADFVDEKPRRRLLDFALEYLSDPDASVAREISRICGISKQILVVRDPDAVASESIIGRMTKVNAITRVKWPISSTAYEIRESL